MEINGYYNVMSESPRGLIVDYYSPLVSINLVGAQYLPGILDAKDMEPFLLKSAYVVN